MKLSEDAVIFLFWNDFKAGYCVEQKITVLTRIVFAYYSFSNRAQISALYHNENCMRGNKINKHRTERVKVIRKKATQLFPTAYYMKTEATYGK